MRKIVCDSCGAWIPSETRLISLVGQLRVPHAMGGTTTELHELDLCSAECVKGYAEALAQQEPLSGGVRVER